MIHKKKKKICTVGTSLGLGLEYRPQVTLVSYRFGTYSSPEFQPLISRPRVAWRRGCPSNKFRSLHQANLHDSFAIVNSLYVDLYISWLRSTPSMGQVCSQTSLRLIVWFNRFLFDH